MRILVCSNSPLLPIISHIQRIKWTSSAKNSFLSYNKALQSFHEPISRIICTDSITQPYNYEIQEQEPFYVQDSYFKKKFNTVNFLYLKLITVPHGCNNLSKILWNEFKFLLSKSSLLYDVNVSGHSSTSIVQPDAWEGICNNYENELINKQPVYECNKVFTNNLEVKSSETSRPTEEQLNHVVNPLTFFFINFFEKSHDYTFYHKNMVFQNNIKGVTIKGLRAYMQSMYLIKIYGSLHYTKLKVVILKITRHIEDGTVRVRWHVDGLSRFKLLLALLNYKSFNLKKLPKETVLDGFSVFHVGKDGLICKHICDKMIPDDNLHLSKKVDLKTKVLGLLGLAPRSPTAGTLNILNLCCKSQELVSCKKLTKLIFISK